SYEGTYSGLQEPDGYMGLQEPESDGGLQEPPSTGLQEPEGAEAPASSATEDAAEANQEAEDAIPSPSAPAGFWITLAVGVIILLIYYATLSFAHLEIFKMLLSSFFPLAILILA